MIYIIFNSDGSFKMTSGDLDGLEKMIEDENCTVKEMEGEDFKPLEFIYSLTEKGNISKKAYTFSPPPEIEALENA